MTLSIKTYCTNNGKVDKIREYEHLRGLICNAYDEDAFVAWMFGCNPMFDGEAPGRILRESERYEELYDAALLFIEK